MMDSNTIRIAGVMSDSIVDGPGLRLSIFTQGCPHACVGCHNPETHDPNGGLEFETDDFISRVRDELIHNPILSGITLSGGEPIAQVSAVLRVAKAVREMGKTVVLFSGYTYEELIAMSENEPDIKELLSLCMLLVDGRFILEQRNLEIKFRGSTNQRLIDPIKSLEKGEVVPWKSKFDF
ncbi:MAG: anaerobic ribonucleoside-triphosphate reductase activating protein [Clostridia bacterium]|nr:anaerobic ribonucleoside-triphosphate reductase activating protein [Clostridia bacterium]